MRPRVVVAVVLVLAGIFGIGLAAGNATDLRLPAWLFGGLGRPDGRPPGAPVRIAIPALGVDARIRPVGLDSDGAIAAPSLRRAHETGWYEDGPTPGQFGPAVIVGHVDDRRGPAVFHGLDTLRPGTRVEIARRDRHVAIFQVTKIGTYDKLALPADEVYGDFQRPELRLITCGGEWVGGETGYAHNVVVFATLVETG